MTLLPLLSALALSLTLSACGGGGGAESATPTEPALSLGEFTGVWTADPATQACTASFAYNPDYSSRLRGHTIAATSGNTVELTVTLDLFADAACAVPQGTVEESFSVPVAAATVPSRNNVIRGQARFLGSHSSAVGGQGITLTRLPDGTAAGLTDARLLADVQGGLLYLTAATAGVAVDGQGYPLAFDPTQVFGR